MSIYTKTQRAVCDKYFTLNLSRLSELSQTQFSWSLTKLELSLAKKKNNLAGALLNLSWTKCGKNDSIKKHFLE